MLEDGTIVLLADGSEGDSCEADTDCAEGLFCSSGLCAPVELGPEEPFIVGGPITITCSADDTTVVCPAGT